MNVLSTLSSCDLLDQMDDLDLEIMFLLLQLMEGSFTQLIANILLVMGQRKKGTAHERQKPFVYPRKTFGQLSSTLSSLQFRRLFRMRQDSFEKLCDSVNDKIGERVFKAEEWLCSTEGRELIQKKRKELTLGTETLGGFISGEIKIAIMLRLMSGASYLDVLLIFGVSTASLYNIFHEVNSWIVLTFRFPLNEWIQTKNEEALNRVAESFSEASGGIFRNCIGALDGVAIKIKAPSYSDIIPDPGNYFCRKGFFALNVQAICDKQKRVLWMSTGHKGSTHDSMAFLETKLFKVLEDNAAWLEDKEFFIVGDSAYPLMSFLMVPFADAAPQSPEDAFNF